MCHLLLLLSLPYPHLGSWTDIAATQLALFRLKFNAKAKQAGKQLVACESESKSKGIRREERRGEEERRERREERGEERRGGERRFNACFCLCQFCQ